MSIQETEERYEAKIAQFKEQLKAKGERIAELEAMAQKMKCCENCKSHINVGSECLLDMPVRLTCKANNYSNWKLKDNK